MEFSGMDVSLNTVFILLALVALETVLSADNAVALAAFVQPLPDPKQQRKAWGFSRRTEVQVSANPSTVLVEPVTFNHFD